MSTPQFDNNKINLTLDGDNINKAFLPTTLNGAPIDTTGYSGQELRLTLASSPNLAHATINTSAVTMAAQTKGILLTFTPAQLATLEGSKYNYACVVSNDSFATVAVIASGALSINYALGLAATQ